MSEALPTFQIVFSSSSAAELAELPKALQLEVLEAFHLTSAQLDQADPEKFARLERDGRQLYRYRANDYRIYFERTTSGIFVHRVLHKNTLKDFLFRSSLPLAEDEALQQNPDFWKLFDDKK